MAKPSSLLFKITLLILIPVALQVGILFMLVRLHNEAEAQLETIARTQKLISLLNDTNQDVYELIYHLANGKFQFNDFSRLAQIQQIAARMDKHLNDLARCAPDDAEIEQDVGAARKMKQEALALLRQVLQSYDGSINGQKVRDVLAAKCNVLLFTATMKLLPKIAEKQEAIVSLIPAKSALLRSKQEQVILIAAIFELLLSIAIAFFLTKRVISRITRLSDNTFRLAGNLPLHPSDQGNDEIGHLDRTIQRLANELKTLAGRESLLVQNALDLIVTLDRSGRITSVNQASAARYGFEPDQLLGMRLAELATPACRSELVEYLSNLKEIDGGQILETQMRRKEGMVLDVILSTIWYAPESCFFCIVHDITAQKNAQRIKNDVVAMVSHDLKTPLSTLDYLLNVFKKNDIVKSAVGDDLEIAQRNVRRLNQLVVDFLDSEKIEANMYELKAQAVNLKEIFRAAHDSCGGLADSKAVVLRFQIPTLVVHGDPEALIRILTNLVSNAINHSKHGGVVSIQAIEKENQAQISVADEGEGLPPEISERIFERFYQVSSRKVINSSGLGLTICKMLVELGKGKIGVDSQPGLGSTFYFTCPLETSHLGQQK